MMMEQHSPMFLSKMVSSSKLFSTFRIEEEEKKHESISSRQIGLNLVVPGGTKTIDAIGKLVMPGNLYEYIFIFYMNK